VYREQVQYQEAPEVHQVDKFVDVVQVVHETVEQNAHQCVDAPKAVTQERIRGAHEAAPKVQDGLRAPFVSAPDIDISDASLLQTWLAAQVRMPDYATLEVDEWKQFGDFFSRTSSWYKGDATELNELADAWRVSVAAHEAQIEKCDASQTDRVHKSCTWHSDVSQITDEHVLCRQREIRALDDACPIVAESVKHRKADLTAVRQVQCSLKVLEAQDDGNAQGHKDCIATRVDDDSLTVEKPPVPDSVVEDSEIIINDIANRYMCIAAAEEEVLDEAKTRCQRDSVEVIQTKYGVDQKQINDEPAAVNQCDIVRGNMRADDNQRDTVTGAARDNLKQVHDEEGCLKSIMDTATASLEFVIQNANSRKPVYLMSDHHDKDAVLWWIDEPMGWYTENDRKCIEMHSTLKAEIENYDAQSAVAADRQTVSCWSSWRSPSSGRSLHTFHGHEHVHVTSHSMITYMHISRCIHAHIHVHDMLHVMTHSTKAPEP
jgi:hypothetical protein